MEHRKGVERRRSREELRRVHMRRRATLGGALTATAIVVALAVVSLRGSTETAIPAEPAEPDLAILLRERQERDAKTVDRVLRHTAHVTRGGPGPRRLALTFDDGPGPNTRSILEILAAHDARATFFNLGDRVAARPGLARRQLREGHAVGGHSNDHLRLGGVDEAGQREQLRLQDAAFATALLPKPRLFRPPYGSWDATTTALLERRRLLMVLWSVDTGDFGNPGPAAIAERALAEAEPGAIILLHDGPGDRPETVAALPLILAGLEARRLHPVTVPELLRSNSPPRDQPPPLPLDGIG
jgi:peptidoglycan-N-acetylglucosamine deacetylase